MKAHFDQICNEGRHWIHFIAEGIFEWQYLVAVDYSQDKGGSVTSVNFAGPVLDMNGRRAPMVRVI